MFAEMNGVKRKMETLRAAAKSRSRARGDGL
jgi:hypothetical protein